MSGQNPYRGWLFLESTMVPERWKKRAISTSLVPLLPEEIEELLGDGSPFLLDADEEDLVKLVARGLSAQAISLEWGISVRSVERRLQRLRERFGVESSAELVAVLASQGFGGA